MQIPHFQIDAFTDQPFGGNPAGVCLLDTWLSDTLMQSIACENNLSETAFVVQRGVEFELRWFTPTVEVDLCGHATLASAFVLFSEKRATSASIRFHTKSGVLEAAQKDGIIVLDFPAMPANRSDIPSALAGGLGWIPRELWKSRDYLAVFDSAEEVLDLRPDFQELANLDCLGVIATAPGTDCDFVSRFFAPGAGINEDPVTGSAHSTLVPYWSTRLGRKNLHARQISTRGGELWCEDRGSRVGIGGKCVLYSKAQIYLETLDAVDGDGGGKSNAG